MISLFSFFFFNDTATTEIYTLSLHDALPISNDQIKEMTRKVSAEVDLVHQQTQNQRYGSSHIGATAKDISNVVTDADELSQDRKSGSAGMPRPISYAVFCLKKKKKMKVSYDA